MQPESAIKSDATLASIKEKLASAEAHDGVQKNIKRHYEHLGNLASSLRKLGMDERDISDELIQVFEQYERALTDYLRAA